MNNSPNSINIVWLKRDLRTQDHAALFAAEQAGLPYLILYLFEPSLIAYKDTSIRHLQFVYHSTLAMNKILAPFRKEVLLCYEEALVVFDHLTSIFKVEQVFSYQESGPKITWDRDKSVAKLLNSKGIKWKEFSRDGVLRGIHNREGWEEHWFKTMEADSVKNTFSEDLSIPFNSPFPIPEPLKVELGNYPRSFQPAGEYYAWRYLKSFIQERGFNYHRHISKPRESRVSCARISPYLSWGNLSIRQVYQFVKAHNHFKVYKRAFSAFLSRLKWHCHFIQKFEVECSYETQCINKGYESMPYQHRSDLIEAWKQGQTGFPLVDACMRCVKATGWINFRMRAMLVSFLCHHLDQDWRSGVYHLAQQFLDYEPGIHFPQFQMQAGTTGVNTIRIYNPVKQAKDHDPNGDFIKKWVPELTDIPEVFVHEPWRMTAMEQTFYNFRLGQDYPYPVVDLEASGRYAREKIWGHRKNSMVQKEKKRILATHTKRTE